MYKALVSLVLLASLSDARVIRLQGRDDSDNTKPVGTNPISIKSQSFQGVITADNSCSHRDLGFWGKVNGAWYAVWGDTTHCREPYKDPAQDPQPWTYQNGFSRDTFSQATLNPLKVRDYNLNGDSPVKHQQQLIPYNTNYGEDSSWGFGGTSICETNANNNEGIVFILRNQNDNLKGAGVARVKVNPSTNITTVSRYYGAYGYWWDSQKEPRYGDKIAYRDENSDYIYAFGGPPTNITDFVGQYYVYGARVRAAYAGDLSQYEYFWGPDQGWKSNRLTTFTSHTAIFWGVGQGQILYSPYYKTYMLVHTGEYQDEAWRERIADLAADIGGGRFLLRTASTPYGPWTDDVKAFDITSDGLPYDSSQGSPHGYAGTAMPFFDASGKTLTVSYTLLPQGQNPVHKIVFN